MGGHAVTIGSFRFIDRITSMLGVGTQDERRRLDARDRQLEDYVSQLGALKDTLDALDGVIEGDGAGGFAAQAGARGVLDLQTLGSDTSTFTAETTILTSATLTFDGTRRVRVSARCGLNSSVAGDDGRASIKEGSTYIAGRYEMQELRYNNGNATYSFFTSAVITPTAGDHTYKLTAMRAIGTGNFKAAAIEGGTWLLVEDIGPA